MAWFKPSWQSMRGITCHGNREWVDDEQRGAFILCLCCRHALSCAARRQSVETTQKLCCIRFAASGSGFFRWTKTQKEEENCLRPLQWVSGRMILAVPTLPNMICRSSSSRVSRPDDQNGVANHDNIRDVPQSGKTVGGDNWIGHVPAAWAAPTSSEDDQIFAPRHETVNKMK